MRIVPAASVQHYPATPLSDCDTAVGWTWSRSLTAELRRHAAGLAVALFLAMILVGPRWWLLTTEPPRGVRIPISVHVATDEAQEASTIRQAYDGKLPVRDPYLVNHRNGPLQAGALWQEAIGVFGHVTGDPYSALTIATTLMAVAAFVLLYALSLQLTGSRWAAVAVLPIAFASIQIVSQAGHLAALRHWYALKPALAVDPHLISWPGPVGFLVWTRYVSPVLVLAPFFGAVLALPRALQSGSRRWLLAATFSLALLVYSYVYYWTAMAVALGGWGAWLLYQREYVALRRLCVISAGALALALPEVVIVASKSLSSSPDVRARVGLADPGISLWVFAHIVLPGVVAGLPFLYALRRRALRGGLYVCLFLAPLILSDVEGVMPQPWHYQTHVWAVFALPAFIAGGADLARYVPRHFAKAGASALAICAVLGAVFCVVWQVRATMMVGPTFAISRDEYAAFKWIDAHVAGDETIVSPSVTTNLLLADLTPAAEYMMDGFSPVASQDELRERFLRAQIAFGYGEGTTFARMDKVIWSPTSPFIDANGSPGPAPAGIRSEYVWQFTPGDVVQRALVQWRRRFQELRTEPNVLSAYPADYLYCGPRERFWPIDQPPSGIDARVVFRQGDVTIYRLTAPSDRGARSFIGCS